METIEININGEYLSNLRFANDVLIITKSVDGFKKNNTNRIDQKK